MIGYPRAPLVDRGFFLAFSPECAKSLAAELAERLEASEAAMQEVLQFLPNQSFAVRKKTAVAVSTVLMTHLEAVNPLVILHRHNWNIRGVPKNSSSPAAKSLLHGTHVTGCG